MAVVHPVISESKSPGKHISPGDIVCITPADRKYLSAGNEPAGIFEKLAGTISPFPDQTR
jgi:hypothetical protein